MSENSNDKRLVELIRRIAREVCSEILEEHLADYGHKQRPASREVIE
jgi:hypothetical protein